MTPHFRLVALGGLLLAGMTAIGGYAIGQGPVADANAAEAQAVESSPVAGLDREALREEIRALLREEPELVIAAIEEFQLREQQRRQDMIAQALPQFLPQVEELVTRGERVLIHEGEDADITLLEFSDYDCGYCRRLQPEIKALLKSDPKIRHVVKALAMIGTPYPEMAITAASAQGDQAKVTAFHEAMMTSESQLTKPKVLEIAAEVGLDAAQIERDAESPEVRARIQRTLDIARALDINGTPALIFPDRLASFVTVDQLQAIIADIRAKR